MFQTKILLFLLMLTDFKSGVSNSFPVCKLKLNVVNGLCDFEFLIIVSV